MPKRDPRVTEYIQQRALCAPDPAAPAQGNPRWCARARGIHQVGHAGLPAPGQDRLRLCVLQGALRTLVL